MNYLCSSLFGRMYCYNIKNHFNNTIMKAPQVMSYNYYELFNLDMNDPDRFKGGFYFNKRYYGATTAINVSTIYAHIIIVDNNNYNKYIERYICNQIYDKFEEEYTFSKLFYSNQLRSYTPLTINDLSNELKSLIYSKSDKNITECSCYIKKDEI